MNPLPNPFLCASFLSASLSITHHAVAALDVHVSQHGNIRPPHLYLKRYLINYWIRTCFRMCLLCSEHDQQHSSHITILLQIIFHRGWPSHPNAYHKHKSIFMYHESWTSLAVFPRTECVACGRGVVARACIASPSSPLKTFYKHSKGLLKAVKGPLNAFKSLWKAFKMHVKSLLKTIWKPFKGLSKGVIKAFLKAF